MARPKKIKSENKAEFGASVRVLGKVYTSTGNTISEAIAGLTPKNCKGMSIITVSHGNNKKDRIFPPIATYRLFNSQGLTREVALKQAANSFDGI